MLKLMAEEVWNGAVTESAERWQLFFLSFSLHLSDSVGGRMLCIPLRQYESINTTGEKVKHNSQNVRPSLQNINLVFYFITCMTN